MEPTVAEVERLVLTGEVQEARALCLADPVLNIAYLSGMRMKDFHAEFIYHCTELERILELFPATFGKSTLGSKWKVVDEILYNPNVRILLVMKTDSDANAYSQSIRAEFETNERLHALYGGPERWIGKPWGVKAMNVGLRQHHDAHYTLECFGIKPSILGHRCDLLICDDIVTMQNSKTPDQRQTLIDWFTTSAQTAPRLMWPTIDGVLQVPENLYWPSGRIYPRILLFGTRFDVKDLYARIIGDPQIPHSGDETYRVFIRSCWTDDTRSESIWPEQVTAEWLKREEASIGPSSFRKRYENDPVDEAKLAFKRAYIWGGEYIADNGTAYEFPGILDTNRTRGDYDERWFRTQGLDPASGKAKKRATWPSLMACGAPRQPEKDDYDLYVIDIWRRQTDIETVLTAALKGDETRGLPGFGKLYHPHLWVIETNAAQQMIPQLQRVTTEAKQLGMRLQSHETQASNKWDPEWGVKGMVETIKKGRISVPAKTASDIEYFRPLLKQLELFPLDVFDYCMVLWFCWYWSQQNVQQPDGFYAEGFDDGGWIDNPLLGGPSWEEGEEGKEGVEGEELSPKEDGYGYTDSLIFY